MWAELDFQNFNPAVIPSEEPTSETSRALLRHKNFDGKTKILKIEKDEDWAGWPTGSLKMTFQILFWAELDFQIFNVAVILSEGTTLDASRAQLRHKNFDGKTKISKIERHKEWVGWLSGSLKMPFQMIFWAKIDFKIFCSVVIPSEGPTLEASRALLRRKILTVRQKCQKLKVTRIRWVDPLEA